MNEFIASAILRRFTKLLFSSEFVHKYSIYYCNQNYQINSKKIEAIGTSLFYHQLSIELKFELHSTFKIRNDKFEILIQILCN